MDYFFPTAIIIIIGLVGFVAAVVAWQQIRGEFAPLEHLRRFFKDGQGALQALGQENLYSTTAAEWLRANGIPQESHAADHLLAIWGGWLAQRLPTLGELHSLSARRERGRGAARWSTGIVAVLLVCGVAGTLVAIHPVLSGFSIQVDANGTVQDAAKSAENVMSMIHQLGNSFWPSIAAITFTLFIVLVRSGYNHAAFLLGRELDRFTVDSLLPAFRLRTLGEEFIDTQVKLGSLADSIERRDRDFADSIQALPDIIREMCNAGVELRSAAKQVATAASRLSTDASGVINGLAAHLGEDGALVRSVLGFKHSVDRNQEAAQSLAAASKALENTAKTFTDVVEHVPRALEKGCTDAIGKFTEQSRVAAEETRKSISDAVGNAVAPLNESASKIQTIKGEISAVLADGKTALEAAGIQLQRSTAAAENQLKTNVGVMVQGLVDDSTLHLESTQKKVNNSLQALTALVDQTMRASPAVTPLYTSQSPGGTDEVAESISGHEAEDADAGTDSKPRRPWYRF